MNTVMHMLMGLIVGYMIGIALAAMVAFVLDLDSVARFVAIGCGLVGAALGPAVANRLERSSR